mmetsp:Transcript_39087/g.98507  ORF Transcript_39087/g.98507 Transcript_39087/m.98507 type:complete len:922 (+) Transcript_39087:221-2986(+)
MGNVGSTQPEEEDEKPQSARGPPPEVKSAIKRMKKTRTLTLRFTNIQQLDALRVAIPPDLKKIELDYNCLSTINLDFSQMPSLKTFSAAGNQLIRFPEFGSCPLKQIDLSRNLLFSNKTDWEKVLSTLHSLLELNLSWNRLQTVDVDCRALTSLTLLDLSGNFLKRIPPQIQMLRLLETLNLRHNFISTLPAEIGQLTNLMELNLMDNMLTELPPSIGQLTCLRHLLLYQNRLTALPDEVRCLRFLVFLDLSYNCLSHFPPQLSSWQSLSSLSLKGNSLVYNLHRTRGEGAPHPCRPPAHTQGPVLPTAPTSLCLSAASSSGGGGSHGRVPLARIPASVDSLVDLSGQLKFVTRLNLAHNGLSTLPPQLGTLCSLIYMDVSHNRLTELPDTISNLTRLRYMLLAANLLKSEGVDCVWRLTDLEVLHLGCNNLTHVPPTVGKLARLFYLNLAHNQLSSLPLELATIFRVPLPQQSLVPNCNPPQFTLLLSYNRFTEVPAALFGLTNLETLIIDGNALKSFPPTIAQMGNLKRLSCNNNTCTLTIPTELRHMRRLSNLLLASKEPVEVSNDIMSLHLDEIVINKEQFFLVSENGEKTRIQDNLLERLSGVSHHCKYYSFHPSIKAASVQSVGTGRKNEDVLVVEKLENDIVYFGVYDGHGGKQASKFAGTAFSTLIPKMLAKFDEITFPFWMSMFIEGNVRMKNEFCVNKNDVHVGTTAVIVLFDPTRQRLHVANAGDSRAVLHHKKPDLDVIFSTTDSARRAIGGVGCKGNSPQWGYASRLTVDHKPSDPDECLRILERGGMVHESPPSSESQVARNIRGHPSGNFIGLAVSRSLGDFYMSTSITPEPHCLSLNLRGDEDVLIIACDGIWDVLSDEEACHIALGEPDELRAALKLRDTAFALGSNDDLSVIVVFLGCQDKKN